MIALVVYAISFKWIEGRRTRNGPWEITFTAGISNPPTLTINQTNLQIQNVKITFPNQQSPATNITLSFEMAQQVPFDIPFGRCSFMDTTFLPGTRVFELYGHEIQLIPRVLTIDRKELPWISGTTIALTNAGILTSTNQPAK